MSTSPSHRKAGPSSEEAVRPSQAVLSPSAAQLRGSVLLFPIALLSLGPYFALWGLPAPAFPPDPTSIFLFIWAFVLGVLLHEGLHGVGHVWGDASWDDVEFGMHWKALTPYARCRIPTRARAYRIAVALPGVVLGGGPLLLGWATGDWLTTFFAFLMWVAAAGDLLVLWVLRAVPAGAWVQDHPEQVGCLVVAGPSASAPAPVSKADLSPEQTQPNVEVSLLRVGILVAISFLFATLGVLMALT